MLILFFLNTFLFQIVFTAQNNVENDIEQLTNNLFDNLRADPNLIGDVELSESSKAFIDRQVENYMNLMLNSQETEYSRSKRSLPENETTSQDNNIVDIKPYKSIPTTSPKDLVIFQQNGTWYAVCLEGQPKEKYSHVLKIKKLEDGKAIDEARISHGVTMAVFPLKTSTFIIVAENITTRQNFEEKTSIFKFTNEEKLETVQRINTSYSSDVRIWDLENDVYMSMAQFMNEIHQDGLYELASPIYKWRGGHFDIIQVIETSGALKIEPFSIGDAHFLAVANSLSDSGNNKVYSEILKYDVQSETYKSFQRILTYRCTDIKHFEINMNREEEHFLVVANSQHRGLYGNANVAMSIIYKFVDNYFLPFQGIRGDGITQWEPVTVEGGDILLLAASPTGGLQCFQYDGWHFVESKIQFRNEVTSRGIRAMHFYKFQDKTIVVIANENDSGNSTNIFELKFSPQNEIQVLYNEMLMWCLDNEKIVEESSDVEILGRPRGDMSVKVDGSSLEKDDINILNKLEMYKSILDQAENQLQNSLQSPTKHVINSDMKAKHVILNNDGFLNSPQIDTLNNITMENFFENLLNINDGFEIVNTMEFEFLRTEEPIFPTKINNLPTDSILHTNRILDVDALVINDSVWLLNDQNDIGNVNNMSINEKFILLKTGDQNFDNLIIENVNLHELETQEINELQIESAEGLVQNNDKIKSLQELKAKKVVIGGYINNLHMPTLDRYALKISGNQNISKTHCFDSIEADNLETNTLSDKEVLNDFVPITGGRFLINKDVKFAKDLSVNSLTALNYLDSIPVKEGRLDVLERNSTERQYVSGIKSFENLELLNPIKLQGKIRSKDLDTMNPVVTIDSNLDLNGDIRITGDVIVEEIIKSNDIVTGKENSLRRVRQQATKLTDPEIPIHLNFLQHVNVQEVFAERINNIDPGSWVVNGAKHTQIVGGRKEFRGGLEITGDTRVFRINDVDMEELETNVLTRDGDQVISGRHYVGMAAADKRIITDDIKFGNHPWKNVMTINTDQTINGTTTFINNLAANITTIGNFKTLGLVNNLNISILVTDAATTGTAFKVFSHKTFKNLTVDNMKVKNGDIEDQMKSVQNRELNLKADMDFLSHEAEIENIHFSGRCNGMPKSNFKIIPRDENGIHVVHGDHEFDKIKIYGKVYISSNFINNLSFSDFVNNTVKIDEPFHFESITLNDIVVDDVINLDGQVENLDLDNIFENNKTEKQIFSDMKVFHKDVKVEGKVHFGGLFNEFNASDICGFSSPDLRKDLVIQGDASFVKGPHVFNFNGNNLTKLQNRVWFNDQPTIIDGNAHFKNDVTFDDDVIVMGIVNDINLQVIATNYLSKSKNQTVPAHMTFLNDVQFKDDISTPKINLGGEVNDMKIEKFIERVILHEPQLFENSVYFEDLTVKDLKGDYLVNNLRFDSEVMRYDRLNEVTGLKIFRDLAADNLADDTNITIQNVDILEWFKNSILTKGNFKISGKKYFKNVTMEKGVSLMGTLNGHNFNKNTIMLNNAAQDVTGRKLFIRNSPEEITFKALKVKGLVNNADIAERAHNQVLKNGDNIFKSEIHFLNDITAKNVDIKKLCNGVNVTELLKNVSTLDALNNFEDSYTSLWDMSNEVDNSLQGQAYFLHYFRPVAYIPNARSIFGKTSDGGRCEIMAFHFENGSNILNFFEWNESQNLFMDTTGFSVNLGSYPSYINKLILGGKDYIYIEHEMETPTAEGNTHLGKLLHFNSNFTNFHPNFFHTKRTILLTSFELQTRQQHCLLFIYYNYEIHIKCADPGGEFYILQVIATEKSYSASITTINGIAFLTTMNQGTDNEESRVTIWKMNNESSSFEIYQTIYEEEPTSLTMISYNCGHYLAVAYGHLQNTMHLGRVAIRRFDEAAQEFTPWQNINLKTPTHIEFVVLPSHELVLYILSDNPTKPFNVYMYEGISGFSKKIVGSAIPHIISMNQFSINNKHFVVAEHNNEISIIEAVFKGEKLY